MTPPVMMLLALVCMFVGAYLTLTFLIGSTWLMILGMMVSLFGPQIAFARWHERQQLKKELDRERVQREEDARSDTGTAP